MFRSAAGSERINLEVEDTGSTVRSALNQLLSRPESGELKKLIFDGETSDPRSTTIILVSGAEISALSGLDTKLKDQDEISLLPVAHGG